MKKVAKNGRKVKATALHFCHFLPFFPKRKKWLKMDKNLMPYFLPFFAPFSKMKKVAKNGRKVKLRL
jgi:hypothetical protein